MADKLEDLRTYVAIVDHGGVNAAAAAMGIARSAVSRRLSDLEARIGVTLIERTTRRFEPTGAGRRYLAGAREILASVDELDRGCVADVGETAVTVSGADQIAFGAALPAIGAFLEANAGVTVAWATGAGDGENPDVRLSLDGDGPAIGTARRLVCASPAYLHRLRRQAGDGEPGDHRAIATPDDAARWRRAIGDARPPIAISVPDDATALVAAVLGIGLALLPEALAAPHLERGELETFLADRLPPAQEVRATAAPDASAAAALLMDALKSKPRGYD